MLTLARRLGALPCPTNSRLACAWMHQTSAVQPQESKAKSCQAARTAAAAPLPVAPVANWPSDLGAIRNDWSRVEVAAVFNAPLLELVFRGAQTHRMYNNPQQVQQCTLLSIKTGGCPETCNYCSQSSSWSKETGLKAEKLLGLEEVYAKAVRAKESGSTRFCMGAAWRGPSQVGPAQFGRVLDMIKAIKGLGMEVCTTLGMVTPEQAAQLRVAGLSAYNHNLDTSPEYYPKVTSSRTYEDRLATVGAVRDAGISVCSGGIIGLGENNDDRVGLLHTLATLAKHPESVPINALVAVAGTPFADRPAPTGLELVRCVATARVLMPKTVVRLSAGRITLSSAEQAMCFLAGANSIFAGDTLLTTPNNDVSADAALFLELGLGGRPPFLPYDNGAPSSKEDFAHPEPAAAEERAAGRGRAERASNMRLAEQAQ